VIFKVKTQEKNYYVIMNYFFGGDVVIAIGDDVVVKK